MKTKILFIIYLFITVLTFAQQEEMTGFLEKAVKAADEENEKNLIRNLNYFSIAIEDQNITPEKLTTKNLELYTDAIFTATWKKLDIPKELITKAIIFLNYNIEEKPKNMFSLGYLYQKGLGISQDYQKAKYWYEKGAKLNNASALCNLGYLYHKGLGVNIDYTTAKKYYKLAMDKGNVAATRSLGHLYLEGKGVNQDYTMALSLFKEAAEKKDANAMSDLGWLYKNGYGTDQDFQTAKYWYEKAAELKNTSGMVRLANLYYNGEGVSINKTYATNLWKEACNLGESIACDNFQKFGNK